MAGYLCNQTHHPHACIRCLVLRCVLLSLCPPCTELIRPNVKSIVHATMKKSIKCMLHRSMQKCWVKYVTKIYTLPHQTDIKKLTIPAKHLLMNSPLSSTQDMQHSTYSMPNFRTPIFVILQSMVLNTFSLFLVLTPLLFNNPVPSACDSPIIKPHSFV